MEETRTIEQTQFEENDPASRGALKLLWALEDDLKKRGVPASRLGKMLAEVNQMGLDGIRLTGFTAWMQDHAGGRKIIMNLTGEPEEA